MLRGYFRQVNRAISQDPFEPAECDETATTLKVPTGWVEGSVELLSSALGTLVSLAVFGMSKVG